MDVEIFASSLSPSQGRVIPLYLYRSRPREMNAVMETNYIPDGVGDEMRRDGFFRDDCQ